MTATSPNPPEGHGAQAVTVLRQGILVKRVPLNAQQRLIIGRSGDSDIQLEGVNVSRHHAELVRDPFGRLWVGDLKSQNRTRVNGLPITTHRLAAGDCIQIGAYELRVDAPRMDAGGINSTVAKSLTLLADVPGSFTSLFPGDKTRLSAAHLSKLMELSRALTSIAVAGDRITALCAVFLSEPFGGRMSIALRILGDDPDAAEPLCASQVTSGFEQTATSVSRSLLRAVAAQRQPLLASNVSAGPVDVSLTLSPESQAFAAVACPIRVDADAIDVLVVTLPPERGTADWLALALLAVEHYQHGEMVWAARREAESHAAIERELDRAREIQQQFLPTEVHVDGLDYSIDSRPCLWVGGDYADVIPLADGRVLLIVADVSGKGLHAALVASRLHAALHVLCKTHADLAVLIGTLNEYLCRHLQARAFVTMVCALLDPTTGQFDYINAGHPPAMVVGPGQQAVAVAAGADIPLGIDPRRPTSHRGVLDRGQTLAMYSDGVTEIRLDNGEFLDVAGLSAHLAETWEVGLGTRELIGRLSERIHGLQQASLPADDQTLLLARRL